MIIYSKSYWNFSLLFRYYGSALPRAIPAAALSAICTAVVRHLLNIGKMEKQFDHPYPFQIFAYIVGFILVFRSNYAYQRYWEGRSMLQTMTSRWQDALTQTFAFDHENLKPQNPGELEKHREFLSDVTHLFSLMHGLACQALRTDFDLRNLITHEEIEHVPPYDPLELHRQPTKSPPPAPLQPPKKGPSDISYLRTRFSITQLFSLNASLSKRAELNRCTPVPILGGMSEQEVSALGGWQAHPLSQYNNLISSIAVGDDYGVMTCIPGAGERVHVVVSWLYQALERRILSGGLATPPPITTRIYALLVEGTLAYEQCRKLMDTPFPFPWSQMVLFLVLAYAILSPFVVAGLVRSMWYAIALEFVSVLTYWTLAEIARDLEDPFVYDPNNLPMTRYQYAFNERVLCITHNTWPGRGANVLFGEGGVEGEGGGVTLGVGGVRGGEEQRPLLWGEGNIGSSSPKGEGTVPLLQRLYWMEGGRGVGGTDGV